MGKSSAAAAPCRHLGAPPGAVVERTVEVLSSLGNHPDLLARFGISSSEYSSALPAAIESLRGKMSASNSGRRAFLQGVLEHLVSQGVATSVVAPDYGEDTVYRVDVPSIGAVAVIQKGCPDGVHSSNKWKVPKWADETYLWWVCPSLKVHPGEHIAKGVNRLKAKFMSEDGGEALSGVIFHNETCGSALRPCPKRARSIEIDGRSVPPPCVYTMPARDSEGDSWNWNGERDVKFPAALLSAFGIGPDEAAVYTGFVGFQRKNADVIRTTISTRYGPARASSHRS
jgi:hypothetical protein